MQPGRIHVRAPARLHFGLFSFGNTGRQYGGVGVMIQSPAVSLLLSGAEQFCTEGPHASCVRQAAEHWRRVTRSALLPACQVAVQAAPLRHVGLGSGTQLALAVAAGLNAWSGRPAAAPAELAQLAGRGQRSAVGTYGFVQGGLIVETGKLPDEPFAPRHRRLAFGAGWPIVLIRLGQAAGLHGCPEARAFAQLPPVSAATRQTLQTEVFQRMLPALVQRDYETFGESVYQYGYRAGECFSSVQGGPYGSEELAALVRRIRAFGVPGVGQSSWGPTLFAIARDEPHARALVDYLSPQQVGQQLELSISRADDQGAVVRSESETQQCGA